MPMLLRALFEYHGYTEELPQALLVGIGDCIPVAVVGFFSRA